MDMDKKETEKNSAMPVLVDLVAMYLITGLLLVVLAALLGRVEMSDAAVSIGIIATYIISCFAGGSWLCAGGRRGRIWRRTFLLSKPFPAGDGGGPDRCVGYDDGGSKGSGSGLFFMY